MRWRHSPRPCPDDQVARIVLRGPLAPSFLMTMSDACGQWSRCVVSAFGVLQHDLKEEIWICAVSCRRGEPEGWQIPIGNAHTPVFWSLFLIWCSRQFQKKKKAQSKTINRKMPLCRSKLFSKAKQHFWTRCRRIFPPFSPKHRTSFYDLSEK